MAHKFFYPSTFLPLYPFTSLPFIFLGVFGIFLFTMAPTISVGDSGEFCAASVILGVPHSPGYPIYCLLGKVFTVIFPFAGLAYRINLMSAFFGALTVFLVYLFLSKNLEGSTEQFPLWKRGTEGDSQGQGRFNDLIPISASLFLAWTLCFWRTSIQSEVFTLSVFFAAVCFLLLHTALKSAGCFIVASFVFGLAAGNQQTIVFILPLFAVVWWFGRKNWLTGGFQTGIISVIMFLIGFTSYLYIPIRAKKSPAINWGNAVNFDKFVRVILRKDYGTFQLTVGEKKKAELSDYVRQLLRYFKTLNEQTGILGAVLGLLGWIALLQKHRQYGFGLLLTFFFSGPFFVVISKLPFDSLSEGILERFYILPMVSFAISAAFALKYLAEKNRYFLILCALLPVNVFFNSAGGCNWRNYYLEYDYGKNILRTLKPGSVFFMDGGDDTFYAMQYLCYAEGRRKDLELHDRGGLVFASIYGSDFRSLPKEQKELRRQQREKEYLGKKPLYYSTFNKKILPGATLRADGILYEAALSMASLRPKTPSPLEEKYQTKVPSPLWGEGWGEVPWEFYTLLRSAYSNYPDYRSRALAPIYVFMRWDNARSPDDWIDYALLTWKDVIWLNSNVVFSFHENGYRAFNSGDMKKASSYYERILKIEPRDKSALLNMGVVREKLGDLNSAINLYERVLSFDPDNAEAYYN
ncbi:MAG: DUF2723 domain-containing protein, partial [Elusimicrobiota bacterium]